MKKTKGIALALAFFNKLKQAKHCQDLGIDTSNSGQKSYFGNFKLYAITKLETIYKH